MTWKPISRKLNGSKSNNLIVGFACLLLLCVLFVANFAQASSLSALDKRDFESIYKAELGSIVTCPNSTPIDIGFCSQALLGEETAPRILLPTLGMSQARGVVILQHGLSDSPYFVRSIAEHMQSLNFMVILPLTPGHGKLEADDDFEDSQLLSRWYTHVDSVVDYAKRFNLPIVLGGFSTGGALSTRYALVNSNDVQALLLFSGALRLPSAAETMGRVWGMKQIAKLADGHYETKGPHPYKYPSVSKFGALVLIDIIFEIRDLLDESEQEIEVPIFAAHSLADTVTLFHGIDELLRQVKGQHVLFQIDESFELCHADLPMSREQIQTLAFDKTQVKPQEECAIPKENPQHEGMLNMLGSFLDANI